MKKMSLLNIFYQKIEKKQITKNLEIYVFGSYLNSEENSDLDILIIYQNENISDLLKMRKELKYEFEKGGLQLDILLLNKMEYAESVILQNIKKQKLQVT